METAAWFFRFKLQTITLLPGSFEHIGCFFFSLPAHKTHLPSYSGQVATGRASDGSKSEGCLLASSVEQ